MKKFTLLFVVLLAMTSAFGQDEGLTPPDPQEKVPSKASVLNDLPEGDTSPPVNRSALNDIDGDPVHQDTSPAPAQSEEKDWKSREEIEKAIGRCEQEREVEQGRTRFYAGVASNNGFSAADRSWARNRQRKASASAKRLTATIANLKQRLSQLEQRVDAHEQRLVQHDQQIEDLDGRTKSLEASRDAGKKRFDDYVGKTDRRLGSLEKDREVNLKGFNWLTIWLLVLTGGVVLGFFLRRR